MVLTFIISITDALENKNSQIVNGLKRPRFTTNKSALKVKVKREYVLEHELIIVLFVCVCSKFGIFQNWNMDCFLILGIFTLTTQYLPMSTEV